MSKTLARSFASHTSPAIVRWIHGGQRSGVYFADETHEFPLDVVPLAAGLQRVGGVEVTHAETGETVQLDNLASVFVVGRGGGGTAAAASMS